MEAGRGSSGSSNYMAPLIQSHRPIRPHAIQTNHVRSLDTSHVAEQATASAPCFEDSVGRHFLKGSALLKHIAPVFPSARLLPRSRPIEFAAQISIHIGSKSWLAVLQKT